MVEEEGNFKDLKHIIAGLRKEEIRLVRQRLNENAKSDRVTNSSRLFEFILKYNEATELKATIHMKESKNTFAKSVGRLLQRLDYILLSESNILNNSFYSPRFRTYFDVTNKLLAADYYRTKGVQHRSDAIVNESIEKCIGIEEYGALVEFLFLKYRWQLLRGQTKEAESTMKEMKHYEFCRQALTDAIAIYYTWTAQLTRDAKREIEEEVYQAVQQIHALAMETKSLQIQYYNLILQFNVAVIFNQLAKITEVAKTFFSLVTENELLRKNMNIGIANLYIAEAYMINRQFELALNSGRIAKTYFAPNSYNYFHTEELEFYALFFLNDFKKAEDCLVGIMQNPSYTKSKYLENKKEYMLACVYFAQERYPESLRLLSTIKEIPKDKTGWNLGMKNLGVMLAMVLGDYETLVRLVESYERDLKRIRKNYTMRERDTAIFKLFRLYVKYNNASIAIEKMGKAFSTLYWLDPQYVQVIPGHEMISVNEWMECFATKTKYQFQGKRNLKRAS